MGEKKSFKDHLFASERLRVCERLKKEMDENSYNDLVDAIHNPKISLGTILRALQAMGIETNKSALLRWRQRVKV